MVFFFLGNHFVVVTNPNTATSFCCILLLVPRSNKMRLTLNSRSVVLDGGVKKILILIFLCPSPAYTVPLSMQGQTLGGRPEHFFQLSFVCNQINHT